MLEFSALISRAVAAILNPMGHTECLANDNERMYQLLCESAYS